MIRLLACLAFLLLPLTLSLPAQAQLPPAEAAAPDNPAPPQTADPAQAKALIQTLKDPAAREKLIQQLSLLTRQQQALQAEEADPVGTRILRFLRAKFAQAGDEFGALGHAFIGLPAAERWFTRQLANPTTRHRWAELGLSLAAVLFGGAGAFALTYLAIRRPRRSIERQRRGSAPRRVLLGILRLVLRLIPVGMFGLAGYSLLSLINPPALVSLATLTIINAAILVMTVISASRFLLAPRVPALRLIPVRDGSAKFMHRWISWIGAIVAFGWFGISAFRLLGLPRVAAHAALKLVGLTLVVILVTLVIRNRRDVAAWIRGDRDPKTATRIGQAAFWSTRRRLAEVWHLLAVAYLVAIFAIWAFDLTGGFDFVLRGTLVSVLVIVLARLAGAIVERLVTHGITLSNDARDRFPRLQERADRYLPIVRASSSVIIWLIALVVLVDIWGIDSLGWFETPEGKAAVAKTISILFVVVSAVVAWEFVSAVIESYLIGAVHDGNPIQRSQRVRTLLPLLRNAFLIFLIVVVVLIVLSEIGLNIAPLLAGAGVVGLAIGFGAQTLVKDVITGVFILFENTIAVGDVVDLGGGHSGLVEHFSIRTIKLRDASGGVHTVPFSNVTSVNNMTKDFAYYVFNVKTDYGQDPDRVVAVLSELGKELQDDPKFGPLILAPLEIIGLDSFGSDSFVIQARFKTKPIQQWNVGREFNRRMKKRFQELGIPQTFPQIMVLPPNPAPATSQVPVEPTVAS